MGIAICCTEKGRSEGNARQQPKKGPTYRRQFGHEDLAGHKLQKLRQRRQIVRLHICEGWSQLPSEAKIRVSTGNKQIDFLGHSREAGAACLFRYANRFRPLATTTTSVHEWALQ